MITAVNKHWETGFCGLIAAITAQGFPLDEASAYTLTFTHLCYGHARRFSQDYNGDFWRWYTQSDGGFFICPQVEKTYRIEVCSNYYRGEMSAQALGITVSLYALCILAESGHEFFIESYYRLRDFAVQHHEWTAISGAID
ncbi:antirestriction protein [Yersinia mollaretii]|uniref:Antirestriction protein n=1 Tax=Yersinia mollaretii TaxID=33060 RepID=A0AA44CME6_YERMO|nr:antirestriction protein [Yersinia mollaretii]NIL23464.1 antirestriction protein [Yersinia mollaretii]CNJ34878.1 antirestriction ArdB family protein [Yersinia mollaretii]CQR09907.1 antirestriction ArdB family protein [Yersinia mollaretii]